MTTKSPGTKPPLRIVVMDSETGTSTDRPGKILAQHLGVEIAADATVAADLVLAYGEQGLELHDFRDRRLRPICVDFTKVDVRPYSANLSRRQPLARAMGKHNKTIIDGTSGLAQDAFLLAALGYRVTAIERNPVLAALTQDALARIESGSATAKALGDRLSVLSGDARQLIVEQPFADVIYLDPMFPAKRSKSALARKEMRIVRDLVGEDQDATELLKIALVRATNRVVVKRPQHAKPLHIGPDFALSGKLVRYDVYLTGGMKKPV